MNFPLKLHRNIKARV